MRVKSSFWLTLSLEFTKLYSNLMFQSTNLFSHEVYFTVQTVSWSRRSHSLLFMSIDGFSTFTENELLPLRLCLAHSMVVQRILLAPLITVTFLEGLPIFSQFVKAVLLAKAHSLTYILFYSFSLSKGT